MLINDIEWWAFWGFVFKILHILFRAGISVSRKMAAFLFVTQLVLTLGSI